MTSEGHSAKPRDQDSGLRPGADPGFDALLFDPLLSVPQDFRGFWRIALLPWLAMTVVMATTLYVLSIALQALSSAADSSGRVFEPGPWYAGVAVALGLAGMVATTAFSVSWTRRRLLGGDDSLPLLRPWDRAHWRFLGFFLGVTLLWCLWNFLQYHVIFLAFEGLAPAMLEPGGPGTMGSGRAAPQFIGILGNFVAIYPVLRLAAMLPAFALDRPCGLAEAWQATQGFSLRLFLSALGIGFVLATLWLAFGGTLVLNVSGGLNAVFGFLAMLATLTAFAVFAWLITVAPFLAQACEVYRHAAGWTLRRSTARPAPWKIDGS